MAAFVGATTPAPQITRTGAQSNGLTSNMVALRRYHRKAYAAGVGYQTIRGTLTSSTSSTAVTGTGTRFTRELFVGAKVMKADGTTLIGYVASIASDTLLTLLANASVAQTALGATTLPRLTMLNFGDSVATLKNQFIIPMLWNALGSMGYSGSAGQNLGGGTAGATTGTVTVTDPNGGTGDCRFNPTGVHRALAASSSIAYGVGGGAFTGNLFTAYLVQGPGQGIVTVDLLDGSNVVQATQAGIDLSGASYALKIVRFNLGGSPAPRQIRVTTTTGTAIVPFDPSFQNTTVKGLNLVALTRGGLQHTDFLSCANPGLVAAYIADQMPDFATYEMREGTYAALTQPIAATLPQVISTLMAGWSDTDWLFYGQTPGIVDAGLAQAAAPSWLENEVTRAYALANGYAFFDGYTPLGSYEAILAMDPAFDGNHVAPMFSHYLASLVMRQMGLLAFINLPLAPSAGISTPGAVRTTSGRLAVAKGAGNTDAGYFETDTFGFDLYARLQRWLQVTDQGGTNRAMFLSASAAQGLGMIVSGRNGGANPLSTAGFYNAQDWGIEVTSAGVVTLRGKDGAGTFKSLTLGTLA